MRRAEGKRLKLGRRRRWLSSGAGYPYAQGVADNAAALRKRDVPVPEIIDVLRIPSIARDAVHYQPLPGKTLREMCCEGLDPDTEQELKTAFTRFVIRLHESGAVSYTHLRAHETVLDLVCRLLLEKKKKT